MSIHAKLPEYLLNETQKKIVSHEEGPLLVIAGPGSGKTRSLVLLALNLLLKGKAKPEEIVLCTFTEKAAHEMQDRLFTFAEQINYTGDLSLLRIGTIHSICDRLITEYLAYTPMGNNYKILDDFTQRLLIYDNIRKICRDGLSFFGNLWGNHWQIAKELQALFERIAEGLIFETLDEKYRRLSPARLPQQRDRFLYFLTQAYSTYQHVLTQTNHLDFAHLEKCAYNLLTKSSVAAEITAKIRYVLVDEYQDTNYIQEQILIQLASGTPSTNFCVVGDEDQAIYRFRGATVRNILEFSTKFCNCTQIKLTENYRSHNSIITLCNSWIEAIDWSNPTGSIPFRMDKVVRPPAGRTYRPYPAIYTLQGTDPNHEAELLADFIYDLKKHNKISDYSDVALLLRTVRYGKSDPYIAAFANRNIPTFCSRANTFFEQHEVKLMVACLTVLLDYSPPKHSPSGELYWFYEYIQDCTKLLEQQYHRYLYIKRKLQEIKENILEVDEQELENSTKLLDCFYQLCFTELFASYLKNDANISNLALFSRQLQTFHTYFQTILRSNNTLAQIQKYFFEVYLYLQYEEGINLHENREIPFLKGHVQIMTIHQAKGLEFPVVAVGRMDKLSKQTDDEDKDKDLRPFYRQEHFEPDDLITEFDARRLYYVAFSRAQNVLILTTNKKFHTSFAPLQVHARKTQTSNNQQENRKLDSLPEPQERQYIPPKPRYNFTQHFRTYQICPRQFEYFHEYNFSPSHTLDTFFGQLIHLTLEKIHRRALEQKLDTLDEAELRTLFEKTFTFLQRTSLESIDETKKEQAWRQVSTYLTLNKPYLSQVKYVETHVQVEKSDYVLTGTIDLILQGEQGLEIIDFKTGSPHYQDEQQFALYRQQLYLYAYALHKRSGKYPDRLCIYWTAEESRETALMEIPYTREAIEQVIHGFDEIVQKIQEHRFTITRMPPPYICNRCDIRYLCKQEGKIQGI